MCVAIIGGNECMERRYIDTCRKYGCKARVACVHSSSMSALLEVMETYCGKAGA